MRRLLTEPADEPMSRREFSRSAVATIAALTTLSAVVEACATLPTAASIRREARPDQTPTRPELAGDEWATWREIADLARLAPTPHNTQPFRIRPIDRRTAEIVALSERFLPEEDHGNRYVASAFGIFAATVEVAGAMLGVEVSVIPARSIDVAGLHRATVPTTLGTVTIVGDTTRASDPGLLDLRRTSRIPYVDRLVDSDVWTALRAIAESRGQRLLEYNDREVVDATLRLNVDAVIDNLGLVREREEIRRWYRTGRTPRFGDGLWERPLNQGALEIRTAFGSPHLLHLPIIRQLATHRYLNTQRGTRHIVLLCGGFASWPELVDAGRALFGLWVEMARHGVYVHPMGSMLTNPAYAARIAERFGVTDCWLVMRAGYSTVPPRSPRLESILL
jgi:nitroreductase